MHRHLKTISKIDMHHLARLALQHQVGRMPVAEPEDVADHAVHGERARVGRAPLEPVLGVDGLEPEDAIEVLAGRVFECVFEDFDLLEEHEDFVVGCHLERGTR